ncbi:glycosyltransferase family 2 protein [Puia dinghuensis]|uniref:glycosyltransferase family 2 protein n=1 Tax=Puia dinghuensis TaxID=1792502 RepID=UPI001E53D936|nr:glycosyltransferase family 2 protein [Puia dinghuensis]
MKKKLPLISCICITRNRPGMLSRIIECFEEQTYPNKELLVLYEDTDEMTKSWVSSIRSRPGIRFLEVFGSPKQTLGTLRNYAIEKSAGEYVCQWDDDDWYHFRRLEQQYDHIRVSGKSGVILKRWVIFDGVNCRGYISNSRLWEGSLLYRKGNVLKTGYSDLERGEDAEPIVRLRDMGQLAHIEDHPSLYIYNYHGCNSWNYDNWRTIFDYGLPLSKQDSIMLKYILDGKYTLVNASILLDEMVGYYFDKNRANKRIPFPLRYRGTSPDLYRPL